jgi:hypothetical protein
VTHHSDFDAAPDGPDPVRSPDADGRLVTPPARSLAWGPDQKPLQHHPWPGPVQEDDGYCQILARSLIRAQLGLSLVCLTVALAVTASFPVLCAILPRLDHRQVLGLPLPLIVLGAGIYPVILLIGAFYIHHADRLEKQFISLTARIGGSPADE